MPDNRPIKFRVWDMIEKRMRWTLTRIDWLITGEPIRIHWCESEIDEGCLRKLYDGTQEFELEQFTGLKDKNGKDIFEGDIVEKNLLEAPKAEVVFCEGCFLGKWLNDTNNPPLSPFRFYDSIKKGQDIAWFEVIGNVHEHSHLLGDSDDN